jgi:hypothetical protein
MEERGENDDERGPCASSRSVESEVTHSASAVGSLAAETVRIRPPDLPGNSCARQGDCGYHLNQELLTQITAK